MDDTWMMKEIVKRARTLLRAGCAMNIGSIAIACALRAWSAGWYWYIAPLLLFLWGHGLHAIMRNELVSDVAEERSRNRDLLEWARPYVERCRCMKPQFPDEPRSDPTPPPPQKNWIM